MNYQNEEPVETEMIFRKICHYCSFQERCIQDVSEKLKEWAVQPKKIPSIINRLQREDYLNEERFVRAFSGGKFRLNKWGRLKIIHELKMRSIPELLIVEGLLEIDQTDYERTLREIIIHKQQEIKGEKKLNIRNKIINFALGKGYEMELILPVIRELKI